MDDAKKLTILPNPHVDLNNARNLRRIFPRASESFLKANETKTYSQLPHPHPQSHQAPALDATIPGKEKSQGRVEVRYRLCRVQPLDPDNACGSTKDCTDALCCCGLIPGDDPTQITLIVEQERVAHYADERTEIELTWPEF
jgi:hypothetical protein